MKMIKNKFLMKNNKKMYILTKSTQSRFIYFELAPLTRDAPNFRDREKT